MKKAITLTLAVVMAGLISSSFAQDVASDSSDISGIVRQLADLGPGVHKIKTDDAGRMKSSAIVGQARISSVLGRAKGLELARKRAGLSSKAEFIKWMEGSVKAVESMTNESIVYLEGSDQGLSESGKVTEVTKDNVDVVAQGIVRGMSLIGYHQDGSGGLLTVVYGWSPNYASLATEAGSTNKNPKPIRRVVANPLPEQSSMPIETKTVISEDAGGFLGNE